MEEIRASIAQKTSMSIKSNQLKKKPQKINKSVEFPPTFPYFDLDQVDINFGSFLVEVTIKLDIKYVFYIALHL